MAVPKRRSLKVTPFVGLVDGPLSLVAEPGEIGALFDVPLQLFMNINNYDYFEMKTEYGALSFPFLPYKDYKIWGFTLKVLTDMLNTTFESSEVALFDEADIPWGELAFPVVELALHHFFNDRENGEYIVRHDEIRRPWKSLRS
ncbi:hypothetical protein N8456_09960 [Porticoccaceae bacterium]|nr:hypothetical protein [Porticoccaceae bacterium]